MSSPKRIGTPVYSMQWWFVPMQVSACTGPVDDFIELDVAPPRPERPPSDDLRIAFQVSRKADLGDPPSIALAAIRDSAEGAGQMMLLRRRADRLEIAFERRVDDSGLRAELITAISKTIAAARHDWSETEASESHWAVDDLLLALREFERADDGTDLLAFRVLSPLSARALYVCLYPNPSAIRFDLEDADGDSNEWDHAVARDAVDTIPKLLTIARAWLLEGTLPRPDDRTA